MQRVVNRFVDYLNTLRTQADVGNAFCFHEARGQPESLKQFGLTPTETRVPTRLDQLIEDAVKPDFEYRVILITGDAGDGKTACCERLAERLYGGPLPAALRSKQRLEGDPFEDWVILKDGSELNAADDPRHNIDAIVGSELLAGKQRFLVAINEGRLRRSSQQADGQRLWKSVVEAALSAREGTPQEVAQAEQKMKESRVLLLNLRDRCLPADRDTFGSLLETFTVPSRWEGRECQGCPARDRCHILANARSLRTQRVRERFRKLLLAAYDAGQALPYRRVQGLIAYGITGGFHCAGQRAAPCVQDEDYEHDNKPLRARYYNTLLGLAPTPQEATRAEPIGRFLQRADPGTLASPECDRLLGGAPPADPLRAAFGDGWMAIEQSVAAGNRLEDRGLFARSLKRKAFFELADAHATPDLLGAALARFGNRFPFESFERYDRAVSASGSEMDDARREVERVILRGLNGLEVGTAAGDAIRQDQLDPHELARGAKYGLTIGLTVTPDARVERLPAPPPSAARYLEHRPSALMLEASHGHQRVRLRVDLGLLELLGMVAQGFRAPQAFGTYLLDIQRFKERLIRAFGAQQGGRTNLAFGDKDHRYRFRFEPDARGATKFDLEKV